MEFKSMPAARLFEWPAGNWASCWRASGKELKRVAPTGARISKRWDRLVVANWPIGSTKHIEEFRQNAATSRRRELLSMAPALALSLVGLSLDYPRWNAHFELFNLFVAKAHQKGGLERSQFVAIDERQKQRIANKQSTGNRLGTTEIKPETNKLRQQSVRFRANV